jgi:hypothetical protein
MLLVFERLMKQKACKYLNRYEHSTYPHIKSTILELSILLTQRASLTAEVHKAIHTRGLLQVILAPQF